MLSYLSKKKLTNFTYCLFILNFTDCKYIFFRLKKKPPIVFMNCYFK